jgi:hypothetical protein
MKQQNMLSVQGCRGFGGPFCRGQTWKRVSQSAMSVD